ncbi:hypothetical protein [Pseudomonas denitrificans (nom. rej.)]|uniref:Uncharacterized protein n=1 Tax=Pseudomonas denitrificans TaxID=43306 RepID=A0A9X7MZJ3_PSEDE|nr:hypothetical protein [Pseudomonas denitrificans (nom. rej.)]QEY72229.1 hypothetical protein F1C79_11755 [Pseudomonas denitrificans (nom. rej.)]
MTINKLQIARTIRNASHNDGMVAELLLELSELVADTHLARLALGMVQQMQDDSKALEEAATTIMGGCAAVCFHSAAYRSDNCMT